MENYFAILKNIQMFVVRINFNYNEATHKHKTETKILGGRTVASTEVYSMPRMELVRGDLPIFIYFKSFFMRTKNDNATTGKGIRSHGFSKQTFNVLKNELFCALSDPEVLPEYKLRVRSALYELRQSQKGGVLC